MKIQAMGVFRSRWFWGVHVVFCVLCLLYVWRNFYRAFPFVELDVRMDRKAALVSAAGLAAARGWEPMGETRQVASFDMDSTTQNYIELEAGGPSALRKVLQQGIIAPYTWRVRRFAEGSPRETHVRFRPDGRPYGYWQKVPEDDPGAALPSGQARAIAEKGASADWGVDFRDLLLVEKSQEAQRSKRVDHSFIYERAEKADEKVGEARYRLKLTVSGDRLTEVTRYLKLPDAFHRRYASMRSANGTIASLAFAAIVLLYGFCACGVGLILLARQHRVQWKMPLAVAGAIAGLQFLDALNQFPLEWMSYDTAISSRAFIGREVANALFGSLVELVVLAIPIMAAESLGRRAFPGHPQLWRAFSREAAPSDTIVGQTIGAYVAVGFHFAYVIWIYGVGATKLGWWNPSEVLFHPNALASYFPWLTSVSSSLHAGLWEECLFRAVPLASAALLGDRFGKRGAWLALAFVLQAVIFGAAHASYPTQPSYARVVELIVPSFVFGGVYLAFGLLPGIIMHYTYDVALFAMPLFMSDGREAAVSRVIVIVLSGLPLWAVLVARWRGRARGDAGLLPESLRNSAWMPPSHAPHVPGGSEAVGPVAIGLSSRAYLGLLVAGVAALGIWAGAVRMAKDAPGLKIGRHEAISRARHELAERGVRLGPEWRGMATAESGAGEEDLFVWRVSGAETYRKLVGTYVEPALWRVRFARFDGDAATLADRAEEYQVYLAGTGEVFRVRHELPEARAGARLEEAAARALAEGVVRGRYGLDPRKLHEISSQQFKLPERRDWLFLWADPSVKLEEGEARLAVKVGGDEVVGQRRFVHVPEEWLRQERSRKAALSLLGSVASALLGILALVLTGAAILGWVRHAFGLRAFVISFAVLLCLGVLGDINSYPAALAQFSTAQTVSSQLTRWLARTAMMTLASAFLPAIWIGYLQPRLRAARGPRSDAPWGGYAAGALLAAAVAVASRFAQVSAPELPQVKDAAHWLPALEGLVSLGLYLSVTAFLLLLLIWAEHRFTRRSARSAFLGVVGLAVAATMARTSFAEWAGTGAAVGAGLIALAALGRRAGYAQIIPAMGSALLLRGLAELGAPGHPGAIGGRLLATAAIFVGGWIWFEAVGGRTRRP